MKRFSPWKLVAAGLLASGGIVAACSSQVAPAAAPPFPLDRYEAAQPAHDQQLLRVAQTGSGSSKPPQAPTPPPAGGTPH